MADLITHAISPKRKPQINNPRQPGVRAFYAHCGGLYDASDPSAWAASQREPQPQPVFVTNPTCPQCRAALEKAEAKGVARG